jgi:hypothetical protein
LRQLETDLESKAGLALADYDVLAQLGSPEVLAVAEEAVRRRFGNVD